MGPFWLLKDRQTNYRTEDRLSAASEIEKLLLLNPDGEPQWILDRNGPAAIGHIPVQRLYIRDEYSALGVVISVKTFSAIEGELAVHRPVLGGAELKIGRRTHGLGNRVGKVLHSPGTQI